jgi:catechol 2,3-dioxygenase-like lactoylglutathione lyase family enzyme
VSGGTAPQAVGGLHEACFGVPDLAAAAEYWAAFGFRPAAEGRLSASDAAQLYGVASAVDSLRLGHLDSDHGLVRLMRWERPLGPGIGLAPLRAHGSRWVAQFVRSALDVANHGAAARRAGWPLVDIAPSFIDLSSYNPQLFGGRKPRPFADRLLAVREYTLIQPLWRQAFLERFHYDSALLGRIDDRALLAASQIVNASLMIASDNADVYGFYARTLGLKALPVQEVPWEQAMASRGVFDLREGETHWCHTFEEPRSGDTADTRRSGRLYLFRFPCSAMLPDRLAQSQPGYLGLTLYTWRVRDAAALRDVCAREGLVTGEPLRDEFGAEAFRCVTPDGMTWIFQQATPAERASLAA